VIHMERHDDMDKKRHGDIVSLPFLCPINVVIGWSKKSNILILASRQPVMMHPCGGEK